MNPTTSTESLGEMAESTARVVAVTAEAVWVEPEQPAACSSCGSAARCAPAAAPGRRLALPPGTPARLGERVLIGVPRRALLGASLGAYMAPPVVMVAAGLAAAGLGGGDLAAGLAALGGLGLSLLGVRRFGRAMTRGGSLRPVYLGPATAAGCGVSAAYIAVQ